MWRGRKGTRGARPVLASHTRSVTQERRGGKTNLRSSKAHVPAGTKTADTNPHTAQLQTSPSGGGKPGENKKSYRRVSWHSHAPIRSGHRCVTVTSLGTSSIPPAPSSLRPPPPSFAKERVRGGIVRDSGCGGGESRCRVEGTQSGLRGAREGRTNPSPGGNNILPGRLRGFRARKSLSAGLSRRRETK